MSRIVEDIVRTNLHGSEVTNNADLIVYEAPFSKLVLEAVQEGFADPNFQGEVGLCPGALAIERRLVEDTDSLIPKVFRTKFHEDNSVEFLNSFVNVDGLGAFQSFKFQLYPFAGLFECQFFEATDDGDGWVWVD